MAANTAIKTSRIPYRGAFRLKSFSSMIVRTPANEITIPRMFSLVIFVLKKKRSAMGAKRGIVEIITAPIVEDTTVSPKLSPRKYINGSKNASSMNHLISCFFNGFNCFNTLSIISKRIELISNRKKTTVNGSKERNACLTHTNENAHKIIARHKLRITFTFDCI